MAVANVEELPYLLAAGALIMFLVNPLYSWIASKSDLKKIILFCYSFLILNLIFFLLSWRVFNLGDSIWLGRIFYVWVFVLQLLEMRFAKDVNVFLMRLLVGLNIL